VIVRKIIEAQKQTARVAYCCARGRVQYAIIHVFKSPGKLTFPKHQDKLVTAAQNLEACTNGTYHRSMLLDFLFLRFRRRRQTTRPGHSTTETTGEDESEQIDLNNPFPDILVIEFQDVIDLHSIPPRQVRTVVEDYLDEAHRRGVRCVRIIHGKGIGVQREMIRSILSGTPIVIDFRDAPAEAGGWGATAVTLRVDEAASKSE
jgi:hypothetical protein